MCILQPLQEAQPPGYQHIVDETWVMGLGLSGTTWAAGPSWCPRPPPSAQQDSPGDGWGRKTKEDSVFWGTTGTLFWKYQWTSLTETSFGKQCWIDLWNNTSFSYLQWHVNPALLNYWKTILLNWKLSISPPKDTWAIKSVLGHWGNWQSCPRTPLQEWFFFSEWQTHPIFK